MLSRSRLLLLLAAAGLACGNKDQGGAPPPVCPTPTGPTLHGTDLRASETWTAAASPHVVTQSLQILNGAKLTIEPCATVKIAAGATIELTSTAGSLEAIGAAAKPITIGPNDAAPWSSITVRAPATASFANVSFSGGGGDARFTHGATLFVDGGQLPGPNKLLTVDHVTIAKSGGLGIWLDFGAAFTDASTALTITQSGSSADPYPVRLRLDEVGTLPSGAYTGNATDEIFVGGPDVLVNSVTIHDRGVPYHMGATHSSVFQIFAPTASSPPAVLTVEPGITLKMEPATQFQLGPGPGALNAIGTAAKPIQILAAGSTPWNNVYVTSPATASFAYVTMSGGGGDTSSGGHGATLVATGNQLAAPQQIVTVDHVTITKSQGLGAWLDFAAGFTDASNALTISQCGNTADPYPIRMRLDGVGTLPTGSYGGNLKDEIFVGGPDSTTNSLTIHDRSLPYHFGETHAKTFEVRSATLGGTPAVLTIEPNVTLKMEPATGFIIGVGSNQDVTQTFPGSLLAVGTAAKPIVFTSTAAVPRPGDWQGFKFEGTTTPANDLDHVSIEYAGGDCSCFEGTCLPPGYHSNGAIIISTWVPPTAFLVNSAIVKSAGNGVVRGWNGGSGPAFLATNTFDVAECPETLFKDQHNACPTVITCQ